MAFDPSKYKLPAAKKLPIVLLLDVSGSMYGEKINVLHDAVLDMVNSFAAARLKEVMVNIAIITFGNNDVKLHTPFTYVKNLSKDSIKDFEADGNTPMGTALAMSKDMIEDKQVTGDRIYTPAVILVSDGKPNDKWEEPLENFINSGRTSKCQRFAISIGNDADVNMLKKFAPDNTFLAEKAADIADMFKIITMTISKPFSNPKGNGTSTESTKVKTDDNDW